MAPVPSLRKCPRVVLVQAEGKKGKGNGKVDGAYIRFGRRAAPAWNSGEQSSTLALAQLN